MTTNQHMGCNFDDFLQEEGILAKVDSVAVKRVVVVYRIKELMKEQKKTSSLAS